MVFILLFFFFNDTATTEIYTLSLHDALPISGDPAARRVDSAIREGVAGDGRDGGGVAVQRDRKSTRLNSSHGYISYAVFCLKKKKNNGNATPSPTVHTTCWHDYASFVRSSKS